MNNFTPGEEITPNGEQEDIFETIQQIVATCILQMEPDYYRIQALNAKDAQIVEVVITLDHLSKEVKELLMNKSSQEKQMGMLVLMQRMRESISGIIMQAIDDQIIVEVNEVTKNVLENQEHI